MKSVRTRIAPSPTGVPHLGNTRTALYDYLLAKKYQGQFVLRLEDTDQKRLVPDAAEKIYQIFDFLRLIPDEGPVVGGPFAPYIQTERLNIYQEYADKLLNIKAAYHCFCKPKVGGEHKPYDKHCLKLSEAEVTAKLTAKEAFVIRVNLPTEGYAVWKDLVQGKISIPWKEMDDKVLVKSNGIPTYHLAATIDDHLMKISHVLRGVEWISSTPVHLKLYEVLGWQVPVLGHMPLLLGPDKSKLSKRHGAKNALEYRDEGYLPEAINNFLFYLGFSYQDNSKVLTLNEMLEIFDETKLQKQNAVFDIQKLNYFNKAWIKKLEISDLATRVFGKFYATSAWNDNWPKQPGELEKALIFIRERITTLNDAMFFLSQIYDWPTGDPLEASGISSPSLYSRYTTLASGTVQQMNPQDWSAQSIENRLRADVAAGVPAGEYFSTIRGAVTGSKVSPPLFDTLEIVGQQETLKRLNRNK